MKKISRLFVVVLMVSVITILITGCGQKQLEAAAGTYYNTVDRNSYIVVRSDYTCDIIKVNINGTVKSINNVVYSVSSNGKTIELTHDDIPGTIKASYDGTTISYGSYSYKK
jgi:uncharacterized lipoprotein YehR (DUF1307 family)